MAMTQLIYLICTNGSVMFGKPFLIIIYDKWEKRLTKILPTFVEAYNLIL